MWATSRGDTRAWVLVVRSVPQPLRDLSKKVACCGLVEPPMPRHQLQQVAAGHPLQHGDKVPASGERCVACAHNGRVAMVVEKRQCLELPLRVLKRHAPVLFVLAPPRFQHRLRGHTACVAQAARTAARGSERHRATRGGGAVDGRGGVNMCWSVVHRSSPADGSGDVLVLVMPQPHAPRTALAPALMPLHTAVQAGATRPVHGHAAHTRACMHCRYTPYQ